MKVRKKMRKTYIEKWEIKGDAVELTYNDGEVVNVSKKDWDRAFGAIVNAEKADVVRDFAI